VIFFWDGKDYYQRNNNNNSSSPAIKPSRLSHYLSVVLYVTSNNSPCIFVLANLILYNHQIPIHSAFFTTNEVVLILGYKDAAKAYDLIRMKIG